MFAPLCQLTVPLRVPPGSLKAQLPQLGAPLHPFALQTPHVGGQDAGQTKVLQTLMEDGERRHQRRTTARLHLLLRSLIVLPPRFRLVA